MKSIPLTKGQVALVDDVDFNHLSKYRWFSLSGGRYASRNTSIKDGKRRQVLMHREIFELKGISIPPGFMVDHKDGDGHNNRFCNLRLATRSQNNMNGKKTSLTESVYKGVRRVKLSDRWAARIKLNGRDCHLGTFDSESEAAAAFQMVARIFHGEFFRER